MKIVFAVQLICIWFIHYDAIPHHTAPHNTISYSSCFTEWSNKRSNQNAAYTNELSSKIYSSIASYRRFFLALRSGLFFFLLSVWPSWLCYILYSFKYVHGRWDQMDLMEFFLHWLILRKGSCNRQRLMDFNFLYFLFLFLLLHQSTG